MSNSNHPPPRAQDQQPLVVYGDHEIEASQGERLLDVILGAGEDHRHICGGRGFCTSCRVELVAGADGLTDVTALERDRLGTDAGRLRLACQTRVLGFARVRVPLMRTSRFSPDED